MAATFALHLSAQAPLVMTRVSTTAKDALFLVDGQSFSGAAAFTWPAGSKHTLEIAPWQFAPGQLKSRYVFQHWTTAAGQTASPSNVQTITADPGIGWYNADLNVENAVSLNFYRCLDAVCFPPGTIWLNQVAYRQDADVWLAAGSTVALQATPNTGYVFAGWGQNGGVLASIYTFVLSSATTVYPRFAVARAVQLTTIPEGLQLLADRAPVTTPVTFDWGWNTTHTLAGVSPQWDRQGRLWMLRSWSDGGALNRSYEVQPGAGAITLTAQFVRAVAVAVSTDPIGLPITVDGSQVISPASFFWASGDQHTIAAPLQAVDAHGAPWTFRAWSNGAPAAQTITVADEQIETGIRLTGSYDPLSRIRIESVPSALLLSVDGADCRTPCEIQRAVGSTVVLGAPTTIGISDGVRLDFSGWEGVDGPSLKTAPGFRKVSAHYETAYRLSLSTAPVGAGSWRVSPPSADGFYPAGRVVSIGIDAGGGLKFRSWAQDLSGTANPQILAMDAPHSAEALFDKTPEAPPLPRIGNAAGDTPVTSVAPASIASLYGADLANTTATATTDPLPQSMGGVTLLCSGHILPLLYVSPLQINFQVPVDLAPGTYQVEIHRAGVPTISVELMVTRNAPGLFLAAHADGSPLTADAPARAGDRIRVYGTGLGPSQPSAMSGFQVPNAPAFPVIDPVVVLIGAHVISPELVVLAPGAVGIALVQFRVPAGLDESGCVDVAIRIGDQTSNSLRFSLQ